MKFDFLSDDELGESYVLRYLALRAEKRIGAVWLGHAGVCWLSPAAAHDPWASRVATTVVKFRRLIDELDPPRLSEAQPLTKFPPSRSAGVCPAIRKQSA